MRCGAPGQRVDASDELGEAKRLGQVVVGAERKAGDEVVGRPGGGEHQDLGLRPLVDERPADVVSVDLGEVAVEHHDVVEVKARAKQGVGPVRGDVDRCAMASQTPGDGGRDARMVFGDEDSQAAHGSCARTAVRCSLSRVGQASRGPPAWAPS